MRTVARINVAAIERNVAHIVGHVGPGTAVCAVVKADGYGHGAAPAARAAQAGGATWLAVVTAGEARALRAAGVEGRLLVLGPLGDDDVATALAADAEVVVWDRDGLERLRGQRRPAAVHVKVDTGMGRLGQRDLDEALALCDAVADDGLLCLSGAMTHFATADEPGDAFFGEQLARFERFAAVVRDRHPGVVLHAANSAATFRDPAAHFDLVRPGVAIYGLDPLQQDAAARGVEPALEWHSRLASVKPLLPGESVGYGRRWVADHETQVGTVQAGYADGVRRALGVSGAEALVRGRRVPLVGTVSMDSFGVDLGPDAAERPGDRVVLVGRDGDEHLPAEELARWIGTINYEVTCAIGARVPREYHRDGVPLDGRAAAAGVA
ncbi:alanine racemase [Patulibacter americanus]|uniref:alanine racemase n=1 Tax=Patulibacter americanus TaxID=588672 RepID=UPI0003B38AAF|nr:alanine racemase [Patulibacter americanus]